jgi:hypothetical protein
MDGPTGMGPGEGAAATAVGVTENINDTRSIGVAKATGATMAKGAEEAFNNAKAAEAAKTAEIQDQALGPQQTSELKLDQIPGVDFASAPPPADPANTFVRGNDTGSFVTQDRPPETKPSPTPEPPAITPAEQGETVPTGPTLKPQADISAATDQPVEKPEDEQPIEVAKPPVAPETTTVTDDTAVTAELELSEKVTTATGQLKTEIQEEEDKLRNENLEIINTIEEDGKQNGIYYIVIGNANSDPKLDTRTIIFPEPVPEDGIDKIVALSTQYGEVVFKPSDALLKDLKSRFNEGKELKDEREKNSKEKLVKDSDGKFSLEMHSHHTKKVESHKLNFLSSDISLIKEAYDKNRENSEIIKLTREKEALKKKTAKSETFLKALRDKAPVASNANSSA